jgi:hypothetical protein
MGRLAGCRPAHTFVGSHHDAVTRLKLVENQLIRIGHADRRLQTLGHVVVETTHQAIEVARRWPGVGNNDGSLTGIEDCAMVQTRCNIRTDSKLPSFQNRNPDPPRLGALCLDLLMQDKLRAVELERHQLAGFAAKA